MTTTTGGMNWERHRQPADLVFSYNFSFLDIDHLRLNNSSSDGYIYFSSDGGEHWRKDSIADELSFYVRTIYFLDSLVGIAGANGFAVFKTTDGGTNWELVHGAETNNFASYTMGPIAFATPQLGLAASGNHGTWLLRTTDGGATWENLSDLHRSLGGFEPTGLSFPDPAHAFFSSGSNLFRSIDSGKTWQRIDQRIFSSTATCQSISFIDSLHGVAVGNAGILQAAYTSDGGESWQNWTLLGTANATAGYTSFPSPEVMYVAGREMVFRLYVKDLDVQQPKQLLSEPALAVTAANTLQVTLPEGEAGVIELSDICGCVLIKKTIAARVTNFPLDQLPRLLIARVQSGGKITVMKILNRMY